MKFFQEGNMEKIIYGIILLIVVSAMFIFSGKQADQQVLAPNTEAQSTVAQDNSQIEIMEQKLAEKISSTIEQMRGVGKVKVLVTLSSGLKKEYAKDESITKRDSKVTDKQGSVQETTETTENDKLVIPSNALPVVVMEESPQIAGVLIIAQGATDPQIREEIFTAVKTLLNIETIKINVSPMKEDDEADQKLRF